MLLDANLDMAGLQVESMCSTAYLHIRNISNICIYLSQTTTDRLVHAFVTSRLNMGNALLHGLPDALPEKLQLVQNYAARVVTGTRKYGNIPPVLKNLHWLPVRRRIDFKILVIVYKCLDGEGLSI